MASLVGSKKKVKIFVLYLMENINYPLEFHTIVEVVRQTDYVMYLDFAEAFNELLDTGLVRKFDVEGDEYYEVTQNGRIVARELKDEVLSSMLDKALTAAFRYLNFKERGIEISCKIEQRKDLKCDVICSITEKKEVIYYQVLTVDTYDRAKRMKDNFYERPEAIYKGVHALLAGNVNYLFS